MALVTRVLDPEPVSALADYVAAGGGVGLTAARALAADAIVTAIKDSGLRGRGGAGFPTGRKWQTVLDNASPTQAPAVVVNAAEGEPGCFKDRSILRANPYRVIEGALIAAHTVGAGRIVIALKRTFTREHDLLVAAVAECAAAGWITGPTIEVFAGPAEYLYGEETALLEAIDGRYPFPRVTPPFRRGLDEHAIDRSGADVDTARIDDPAADAARPSAAGVELAAPDGEATGAPALVDNVETMANVPGIIANGADWFRSVGTDQSPGTIVCTVSGRTRRAGVAEFELGTPLREVIETVGGGVARGRSIKAVMVGVSTGLLTAHALDTPLTYEAFAAAGSGLGTAGFIVFDDATDLVSVGAGVSHFLAVESCGQCRPCKQDGGALADVLVKIGRSEGSDADLVTATALLDSVIDRARCNLASQQQAVIGSVLALFAGDVASHTTHGAAAVEREPIAGIKDIVDGVAILDPDEVGKQPDWSHHLVDSQQSPAERLDDPRMGHTDL
jgi:NADH-quinone oxidoreductase subunit F